MSGSWLTKVVGPCDGALSRLADLVAADRRPLHPRHVLQHQQLVARRLPDGVLQLPGGLRRPQVLRGRVLQVSSQKVISPILGITCLPSIRLQAHPLMPCS